MNDPGAEPGAPDALATGLNTFRQRLDQLTGPALATPTIVVANVILFVVMGLAGAGWLQVDPTVHIRFGSNFGPLTLAGEWWRLGSSAFIHFGLMHLAFNMWALWDAGRLVERLLGTGRFVLVYAFAGLCGSLASLAWNPGVNSAGASGAIFGVFGALLAYVVNPRNGVPLAVVQTLRNSALTFIAFAIAFGFFYPGIDNAAHLGGLIGGAVMGWLVARPLDAASRNLGAGRQLLLAVGAGIVLLAAAIQFLGNPSPSRAAELDLRSDFLWFAETEAAAISRTRALVDEARSRDTSATEFAAALEREVMPQWEAMEARVSPGYALEPDSALAPVPPLLQRYAAARIEASRLFASAARLQDNAALERAAAASQHADQLAVELREAWLAAQ